MFSSRTTIAHRPGGPRTAPFPQVTIDFEGGEEIRFGTQQFSTANALDQDIIEIHNDLTWVRGRHQFTIGTHNELFRFRNLFIRDNFGVYEFTSPERFAQGLAQSYSYSFSRTSDPRQAAEFWVYQLGFYAGDQWRVRDDLSLTYGLRLDAPIFPDTPTANQYSNTGNEFERIRVFFNPDNRIPFSANPNGQSTDIGSASTNEINLVDPDYRFPQLLRGNLGYDRDLGFFNLIGSVELLFSKTLQYIDYRNLNLVESGAAPDGQPTYGRLELLAGAPVQPVRLLPHSGRAGGHHAGRLLQRAAGASLQLPGRERQQRRRDAGQRPALRAARRRRGHRHRRRLRRCGS